MSEWLVACGCEYIFCKWGEFCGWVDAILCGDVQYVFFDQMANFPGARLALFKVFCIVRDKVFHLPSEATLILCKALYGFDKSAV